MVLTIHDARPSIMNNHAKKLPWVDPDGCKGVELIEINARRPLSWYGFSKNYLYNIERTQREVKTLAFRIQSMIAFCDATCLKPADSIYALSYDEGFDHTRFWQTPERRAIITTEPYHTEKAIEACEARGWPSFVFGRGIGLCEGAMSGTRLILISPNGVALQPLISALTLRFCTTTQSCLTRQPPLLKATDCSLQIT